jgi:hypothetical protein
MMPDDLEKRCSTLQKENAELLKTVRDLTSGLQKITKQVDAIAAFKSEAAAAQAKKSFTVDEVEHGFDTLSQEDRAAALIKSALKFPREIRPGAGGHLKGLR